MKTKRRLAALAAALLMVLALASCELAAPKRNPGTLYIVTVGIEYKEWGKKNALKATKEESIAVSDCLAELAVKAGRPCEISRFYDTGASQYEPRFPSKSHIKAEIGRISAEAGPDDTLLVFFSCHGYIGEEERRREDAVYGRSHRFQGTTYICTINSSTPKDLEHIDLEILPGGAFWSCSDFIQTLRSFPGQKCVLADFCYSGSLLGENNVSVDTGIYYDTDPLFDLLASSSEVAQEPDLFILTASKPYEQSWEGEDGSYFTQAALQALGWDAKEKCIGGAIPACEGGVVSLQSLADKAQEFLDDSQPGISNKQHMKITGSSEDLVLFEFDRKR